MRCYHCGSLSYRVKAVRKRGRWVPRYICTGCGHAMYWRRPSD